ncbi:uncharacterized protein LOC143085058 isoform X2 [Mytilus galloprovincialis]|uniref:uncharacterized protein LOC143085058 isoform X2 n=1 Tax=Mytilus galloprovincialis TaxID=29158 RepID=UPI003F7B6E87
MECSNYRTKISSYTGLTVSVIVAVCFGFEFKCPESSQWKFRKQICSTPDKYSCLYDIEKRIYTESCTENRDFVKAGKRYVRRGGIDSGDCIGSRYQPRKFWSNVNSVCEMVKNTCFEAGQVTVSDGSTVEDRACRCDFQKGFVFVAKQTDICSCIPSKEDCSCYSTTCHESEILTEDFYCENIKNMYKEAGKCLSIGESEIKLPKSTSLAGKSRKVYALDNNEHHRKEIHRYSHIVGKYLILCIGSFVMIFACAANIWIQATWHKVNVFQTVNLTPTSLLH